MDYIFLKKKKNSFYIDLKKFSLGFSFYLDSMGRMLSAVWRGLLWHEVFSGQGKLCVCLLFDLSGCDAHYDNLKSET